MSWRKLGLALAVCAAPAAHAADDAGRAIVMQGTPAGATACIACHGLDGAGNAGANFPRALKTIAETDALYHDENYAYGDHVHGHTLGKGVTP